MVRPDEEIFVINGCRCVCELIGRSGECCCYLEQASPSSINHQKPCADTDGDWYKVALGKGFVACVCRYMHSAGNLTFDNNGLHSRVGSVIFVMYRYILPAEAVLCMCDRCRRLSVSRLHT